MQTVNEQKNTQLTHKNHNDYRWIVRTTSPHHFSETYCATREQARSLKKHMIEGMARFKDTKVELWKVDSVSTIFGATKQAIFLSKVR